MTEVPSKPHEAVSFSLKYTGELADEHELEGYDAAVAILGFQRSLALTTHLVVTGEIITQAPALKNARVALRAPIAGSWELLATIYLVGKGIHTLGTAPRDTPIGHMVSSVYDYVVSTITGVHVDYSTTIGAQLEQMKSEKIVLPQHKLDALAEKCETAVTEMHRPIVKSQSAIGARIASSTIGDWRAIGPVLDAETYEYIAYSATSDFAVDIAGLVSSYNSNSYKGRIYVSAEGRPISFELSLQARDMESTAAVAGSLEQNVVTRGRDGYIQFKALRVVSRSGRLKRYIIVQVGEDD